MENPNWAEVAMLAIGAATLAIVVWKTFFRQTGPEVVCRFESAQQANHPDLYKLTISPIPGWEGTVVRVSGQGVLLAVPEYRRDEYGGEELLPAGPMGAAVVLDTALYAWSEQLRHIHLWASRSSSRSHRTRTITVEILMSSPRRLRIAKRINAPVAI